MLSSSTYVAEDYLVNDCKKVGANPNGYPLPQLGVWTRCIIYKREIINYKKFGQSWAGVGFWLRCIEYSCADIQASFFPRRPNKAEGILDTTWVLRDFAKACGLCDEELHGYNMESHYRLLGRMVEVIPTKNDKVPFPVVSSIDNARKQRRHWQPCFHRVEDKDSVNIKPHTKRRLPFASVRMAGASSKRKPNNRSGASNREINAATKKARKNGFEPVFPAWNEDD
jgi:hypothetical protein